MTSFHLESRDITKFGQSPCQKVVKLHLYAKTFEILVHIQLKIIYSDSSSYDFLKIQDSLDSLRGPKLDLITSL